MHPSDTAPALVALDASFRIVGPTGERIVEARDFFVLPGDNPARENVLASDEILAEVILPAGPQNRRSTYQKVLDREAWTHALASVAVVLDFDGVESESAGVRVSCSAAWHRFRWTDQRWRGCSRDDG